MLDILNDLILTINDIVWGLPLMLLLLSIGIYLTFRLRLLQIFLFPKAIRFMLQEEEDGRGEISTFGALCTSLSATIGNGNIVGVATAVAAGGPGALFWMVFAAFLGMTTKYAEGVLAVKYRKIDKSGHVLGGPFYYIEHGLGEKYKWLAKAFAFFGVMVGLFGGSTLAQVSGITSAVKTFFDPDSQNTIHLLGSEYSICIIVTGIIVTLLSALIILGGLKRISTFSEYVIPFMALTYVLFCGLLLVFNYEKIPYAFSTIIKGAFNPSAVTGGIIGTMMVAMQKGIARGIFSNEAGLGSTPIVVAAARTNEPVRQGLVSMTGNFFDTIIICSLTGLSVVITDAWTVPGLEGAAITSYAFQHGLPLPEKMSAFILMVFLIFFSFTTIIGWNYYSSRCLEYLFGYNKKAHFRFDLIYIIAIFIGPYLTLNMVWNIADICNGLMAFPNIIALFALSNVVISETKDYFKHHKE